MAFFTLKKRSINPLLINGLVILRTKRDNLPMKLLRSLGQNDNLCKKCGARVSYRYHIISDFIIGSHALLQSNILLTRDRGFYKDYYKDLMINPSN